MLLFKKKFLELIRRGEKTQTIRLWHHRRMKPGQRSYIPGIGYIAILVVDQVELDQLTDADAIPDGFPTADLLRQELLTLYADEMTRGFRAYRICFSVYSPQDQERMKAEKKCAASQSNVPSDHEKRQHVEKTLEKLRNLAAADVSREK